MEQQILQSMLFPTQFGAAAAAAVVESNGSIGINHDQVVVVAAADIYVLGMLRIKPVICSLPKKHCSFQA
jgi:hypothetical protein